MANFPSFTPIYGSTKTVNTKAVIVDLGDGYQHRTLFGLPQNQSPMTLNLTFNVSESESDTIFSFLNDRDLDQASFDYTPTDESGSLKFICTEKSKSIPYNNRATIQATFREVFEPGS